MVVKYRPGKLGAKPDALTRRSDVYPKGESRAYAQSNPHNFHSILRVEQLMAAQIIDTGLLLSEIRQALPLDEYSKNHMERLRAQANPDPNDPLSILEDGLLRQNGLIYVPDHADLRLKILEIYHDHKIAGHP
jgi:hypothetical protein